MEKTLPCARPARRVRMRVRRSAAHKLRAQTTHGTPNLFRIARGADVPRRLVHVYRCEDTIIPTIDSVLSGTRTAFFLLHFAGISRIIPVDAGGRTAD